MKTKMLLDISWMTLLHFFSSNEKQNLVVQANLKQSGRAVFLKNANKTS